MFNAQELEFIFTCVELRPSPNTQIARRKADIMYKLSDALDRQAGSQVPVVEPEGEDK